VQEDEIPQLGKGYRSLTQRDTFEVSLRSGFATFCPLNAADSESGFCRLHRARITNSTQSKTQRPNGAVAIGPVEFGDEFGPVIRNTATIESFLEIETIAGLQIHFNPSMTIPYLSRLFTF
jgi:hypothetical protein